MELLLNIKKVYAKILVQFFLLQSIILIVDIDMVYNSIMSKKPALKALNQYEHIYYLQMLLFTKPNTLLIISQDCIKSFVASHINYLRFFKGIYQLFFIQKAMITDINFIISSTSLSCMFSQYSKLFHSFISLQLVFCFFIYTILKNVISVSYFCSTLYKTKIPR